MNITDLLTTATEQRCPNDLRTGARIAIVGEAPGEDEIVAQQPFVGAAGRLLWALLGQNGVSRTQCAIYNVSQVRPPGNRFSHFDWTGPEITSGLADIDRDLVAQRPSVVLVLGNPALCAAKGGTPIKKRGEFAWPWSITDWTGSLFWSDRWQCKCLACVHPAAVLRTYSWMLYLKVAAKRLAEEQHTNTLVLPERTLITDVDFDGILFRLQNLIHTPRPVALDIEGGIGTMSCIAFATSAREAFIVPFTRTDGTSLWTLEQEVLLWRYLANVISNPSIPKVLQNYLYDSFVLAYHYRTPIYGLQDDTMLKHWELLPEFEKALNVQASLYTREPYWKDARSTTGDTLWRYCCTDAAVTYEINDVLEQTLAKQPDALRHYRHNLSLLPACLYMQCRGIKYDTNAAITALTTLDTDIAELQHKCNTFVLDHWPMTSAEMTHVAAGIACYKKAVVMDAGDLVNMPRKEFEPCIHRIAALCAKWPDCTDADKGWLFATLGLGINVDSSPQMVDLLYNRWRLPKQFKKVKGRRTDNVTADQLAMLDLFTQTKDHRLMALLRLRGKIDQRKELLIRTDTDGRVRCALNLVGQETGRISTYTSITGSGTNLTTVPKPFRKLYVAD